MTFRCGPEFTYVLPILDKRKFLNSNFLRDLGRDEYDVLIRINLLREGLDLPKSPS